ncbi:hypothetical protein [Shewanella donghaensis]|uniref:hypothetical protein n=1 Tax=Shewanella donghaensis TaxID=238836 RepID=UPI0011840ED0|nr:hypothetical protein [Shewanella donghaensis]
MKFTSIFTILASLAMLAYSNIASAQWHNINSDVFIQKYSRPIIDKENQTYSFDVTIRNRTRDAIKGNFRLLIDHATVPVINVDGQTANNVPYYEVTTQELAPKSKVKVRISFPFQRGFPRYTPSLEYAPMGSIAGGLGESVIVDEVNYFTNEVIDDEPEMVYPGGTTAEMVARLQDAINRATEEEMGGVVRMAPGEYVLTQINLKSNVRLEIDPEATIKMVDRALFSAGRDAKNLPPKLYNIEITSTHPTKKFTVDVNNPVIFRNSIPFRVGYVENFAISNFHVEDNYSIFPSVFIVADSDIRKVENNETYNRIAVKGVVQNATNTKVATGYALVQLFSGRQVLLRDLTAQGGLTIRLEPGSGKPNDYLNRAGQNVGSITDIRMINIHNYEGMAAVFLKPHEKIIDNIWGTNITATDSAFAVMANASDSTTFTRGHFSNTRFDGVIRLDRTNDEAMADIGPSSMYFVTESERVGRTNYGSFPDDPSGRRKHTKPMVPVLIASAMNSEEDGPFEKGRYNYDISAADIQPSAILPLERPELVLYREDAVLVNGRSAHKWINE